MTLELKGKCFNGDIQIETFFLLLLKSVTYIELIESAHEEFKHGHMNLEEFKHGHMNLGGLNIHKRSRL
ncbi:hypothetical protein L2E82_12511 [Cichorium intybus]|uniref:Uncharacterized protein n=1 Tax=Cichorium intybus TaxID=13427 RepID=A0ACB9GGA5_CICIN|nr:hypothetical protein L2E82_12511 [Cichorium intybus]